MLFQAQLPSLTGFHWVLAEGHPIYKKFCLRQLAMLVERHVMEAQHLTHAQKTAIRQVVLAEGSEGPKLYDHFLYLLGDYSSRNAPLDPSRLPHWLPMPERPRDGPFEMYVNTAGRYTGTVNCNFDRIQTETLMIHARDDPIVGFTTIHWEKVKRNAKIISMFTERGGHTAFSSGFSPIGPCYTDNLALDYFSAILLSN